MKYEQRLISQSKLHQQPRSYSFWTTASEKIVSVFNLRRNMSGESWLSRVFAVSLLRCWSNQSCTKLLACGSTVEGPQGIEVDFPFGQRQSWEGPARSGAGWEHHPCHWYLVYCCLMLGMSLQLPSSSITVSVNGVGGWPEERSKATPHPPFFYYILSNVCQGCSLNRE